METLYRIPFGVLECPNLILKKPGWLHMPSPMFVFSCVLLSYFLVTGGKFDLNYCYFCLTTAQIFERPYVDTVNLQFSYQKSPGNNRYLLYILCYKSIAYRNFTSHI